MKRLVIIAAMGVIVQKTNAQAFKVGDINCNHSIINHTFTPGGCSSSNPSASQTYTFDIDGDFTKDIEITSGCNGGSSNSCSQSIQISSATGFQFVKDSTVSPPVIKNLALGSALNSNSNWVTMGYPYVHSCTFSNPFTWGQQTDPFYVGFRKVLANDTIYGWIKTSSIYPGEIFSIAYKNGAYCTGIDEQNEAFNSVLIFPNPNNGEFEVHVKKETILSITNELGQLLKTIELNSENNFSSKLDDLQSGVYFIGNKLSRQKIVVIK